LAETLDVFVSFAEKNTNNKRKGDLYSMRCRLPLSGELSANAV